MTVLPSLVEEASGANVSVVLSSLSIVPVPTDFVPSSFAFAETFESVAVNVSVASTVVSPLTVTVNVCDRLPAKTVTVPVEAT